MLTQLIQEKKLYLANKKLKAADADSMDKDDELLMVTRISAQYETPKEVDQTFKRLRLYKPYTAVFVRRNKETLAWLFVCRPYLRVVIPTGKMVHQLIQERGFGKVCSQEG